MNFAHNYILFKTSSVSNIFCLTGFPGFTHCQMQPQVQNPVSQSVLGSRTTPMFAPTGNCTLHDVILKLLNDVVCIACSEKHIWVRYLMKIYGQFSIFIKTSIVGTQELPRQGDSDECLQHISVVGCLMCIYNIHVCGDWKKLSLNCHQISTSLFCCILLLVDHAWTMSERHYFHVEAILCIKGSLRGLGIERGNKEMNSVASGSSAGCKRTEAVWL